MRALISFVTVAVVVVAQLTIVDRIAFPGGTGPDLVLLAVTALALANGPLAGALIGFWAGLALDVAPPGSHFVGEDALVFCLIGYLCGLLADDSADDAEGHTALFEIVVVALGAVCGEALLALLGAMLSDPRVTWDAIKHVLPVAVAYDVLLCPFALYAVAAVLRLAGARGQARRSANRSDLSPILARAAAPGARAGAVREVSGGNGPRLRLSDRGRAQPALRGASFNRSGGSGFSGSGLAGSGTSLRGTGTGRAQGRREPKLKLGQTARTPASRGAKAGAALAGALGGSAKVRFGGRRGEGIVGGSLLGGSGGAALRSVSSSMGRSLLGGSMFSRSRSALNTPSGLGGGLGGGLAGTSALGRSSLNLKFSRSGMLTRLSGPPRRGLARKSPGKGWLRGSTSSSQALGGGALGGGKSYGRREPGRKAFARSAPRLRPGRTSLTGSGPARLHMPRPRKSRRIMKLGSPRFGRKNGGFR